MMTTVSTPWIITARSTPTGNLVHLDDDGVYSVVYKFPGRDAWAWLIVRDYRDFETPDVDAFHTQDAAVRDLEAHL